MAFTTRIRKRVQETTKLQYTDEKKGKQTITRIKTKHTHTHRKIRFYNMDKKKRRKLQHGPNTKGQETTKIKYMDEKKEKEMINRNDDEFGVCNAIDSTPSTSMTLPSFLSIYPVIF